MIDMPNKDKCNDESVSYDSYEKMAEHYFSYIDTKPFNAYYESKEDIIL